MNPLVDKLNDLAAQRAQIIDKARAIVDKPEPLTALDRRHVQEYLELLEEIQDYSARLTRRGEKWRCHEQRHRAQNIRG